MAAELITEPHVLCQGSRHTSLGLLVAFSHKWPVVQEFYPSRSNNLTQGVSHDGTEGNWEVWIAVVSPFWSEAPEPTTFLCFWSLGTAFLDHPLVKKCSRTVFHRNKWGKKETDIKPEILVLRVYTYDLAEGAEGEGLTKNTMQIPPD